MAELLLVSNEGLIETGIFGNVRIYKGCFGL